MQVDRQADEGKVELAYAESRGKLGSFLRVDVDELEQEYELLLRQQEDDVVFMDYREADEEMQLELMAIDDEYADISNLEYDDFEAGEVDFYKNKAIVFEQANNGIEAGRLRDEEVSMMSISDIPIDQLLNDRTGRQRQENAFKKTVENTMTACIQANYSAVWFIDMKDGDASKSIRVDSILKNFETLAWTRMGKKYTEKVPFTDRERARVVDREKPKKPVLLDPKVTEILD